MLQCFLDEMDEAFILYSSFNQFQQCVPKAWREKSWQSISVLLSWTCRRRELFWNLTAGAFLKKFQFHFISQSCFAQNFFFFSNFTSIAFLKYHYIATFICFREESWQWLSVLLNWESHQWLKVINAIAVILSNVIRRFAITSLYISLHYINHSCHVQKYHQAINSVSSLTLSSTQYTVSSGICRKKLRQNDKVDQKKPKPKLMQNCRGLQKKCQGLRKMRSPICQNQ